MYMYLGIAKVIDGSWYECLGKLGAPRTHRGGQGANDTQGGHDVVLVRVGKTSLESPRELTKGRFYELGCLDDLLNLYRY